MQFWVFIKSTHISIFYVDLTFKSPCSSRCVTREGGSRGGLPCPFLEIGKKCSNFGKKASKLWSSMGEIFHLKCNFFRVSRGKNGDFSLMSLSFSCCRWLFIEVPLFQENSSALKNSWLWSWVDIMSLALESLQIFF